MVMQYYLQSSIKLWAWCHKAGQQLMKKNQCLLDNSPSLFSVFSVNTWLMVTNWWERWLVGVSVKKQIGKKTNALEKQTWIYR